MSEESTIAYIDFEEEKAKLWRLAYSEIIRIIMLRGLANQRIELSDYGMMKSVMLELPNVLILEDNNGNCNFAECFIDDALFEVYEQLIRLKSLFI